MKVKLTVSNLLVKGTNVSPVLADQKCINNLLEENIKVKIVVSNIWVENKCFPRY